jgi:uncharacterized protein YbjT (DUF2867 family)
MKSIVIGATGATARELLQLLLNDNNFDQVTIFVRTTPPLEHEKLKTHVIDFNEIENNKDLVRGDILFSGLVTTLIPRKIDY